MIVLKKIGNLWNRGAAEEGGIWKLSIGWWLIRAQDFFEAFRYPVLHFFILLVEKSLIESGGQRKKRKRSKESMSVTPDNELLLNGPLVCSIYLRTIN